MTSVFLFCLLLVSGTYVYRKETKKGVHISVEVQKSMLIKNELIN